MSLLSGGRLSPTCAELSSESTLSGLWGPGAMLRHPHVHICPLSPRPDPGCGLRGAEPALARKLDFGDVGWR